MNYFGFVFENLILLGSINYNPNSTAKKLF